MFGGARLNVFRISFLNTFIPLSYMISLIVMVFFHYLSFISYANDTVHAIIYLRVCFELYLRQLRAIEDDEVTVSLNTATFVFGFFIAVTFYSM